MNKYEELQAAHQHLLEHSEEVEDPKEMLEDVQAYIEQIKADAEFVPDARERNQLRANLRYWASFVYDQTGTYPNTNMRPASVPSPDPKKDLRSLVTINRFIFVIIIAAIVFIVTGYFFFDWSVGTPGTGEPVGIIYQTLIPTSTSTPTPTQVISVPTNVPTPTTPLSDRTATVAALLTEAAAGQFTATPTAYLPDTGGGEVAPPTLDPTAIDLLNTEVAYYSATDIVLLPATGGGGPSTKTYMTASLKFTGILAKNCGVRTLAIALDPIDLFSGSDLFASVQLSQGGRVVAAAKLPFQKGTVTFTLPNSTSNAAVLVQVDHPQFLFETVIAQFYADCSRNRLFLYYRPDLDKEYFQTDPSNLQLSWRMSTWGPSPDLKSWIATLLLVARGGDGNYIFWASGDAANAQEDGLLLDNRLLVSKEFCDPAQLRLGVTSAGLTTKRDMVLQVPDCIQISPTPTP